MLADESVGDYYSLATLVEEQFVLIAFALVFSLAKIPDSQ